jgi:hypothetical protein
MGRVGAAGAKPYNRGSTGSDSSASTPNTASCTRHNGSPSASRSRASRPRAYSRSASDRLWLRKRPADGRGSRAGCTRARR